MLNKIIGFFLKKKILKEYYEQKAQEIMKEYLQQDKTCIGIHDRKGRIKKIKKLKVIENKASN